MRKSAIFLCVAILLLLFFSTHCLAQLIDYERLRKIRERGNVARSTEGSDDEGLPGWIKAEPKVTNRAERRYDVNKDGYLQTAEVKVYLRKVLKIIDSKGGFTINSDILKEYDKNKDGVISRIESDAISKFVR